MCGIAAHFGFLEIKKQVFINTAKKLYHRGPDNTGFFLGKKNNLNISLVHTRLSIIDLDARSNQPYHFDNLVLIFNGEIYNYLELKNKLIQIGYSFNTTSDTEVFIKAYHNWGLKAFEKFKGMWSSIIYDKLSNKLIISRDIFGEKPLFFLRKKDNFFFGSTISSIFSLSEVEQEINTNQVKKFLVNGYKSIYKTKETFFKNIFEFPKNSVWILNKELKIENKIKIWELKKNKIDNISFDEATAYIKKLLIQNVLLKTRSDVPLGFCLSGGVDSNTLISIAKNILHQKVLAFSVVNYDKRYEENIMINHSLKELKIETHKVRVKKKGFINSLRKQILKADRPIYTISYYLHNKLIKRMSKEGVKVSISGTGADEIFTGYYDHYNLFAYEMRNNMNYLKDFKNFWESEIEQYVRNPYLKNLKIYFENPNFRDHIFPSSKIFQSYLNSPWYEKFSEKNFVKDMLKNRMLNELFYEAVPIILAEDDNNSMQYSIENRSPFLDTELLDFIQNLPTNYLMNGGIAKSLLRNSMKGLVSEKILFNTRKVGFNSPILDNIDIKKDMKYLINDSYIYEIVKKKKILNLLKKNNLNNTESKFLFNFISCKVFLDEYY